jgi:hypothetical protein
VSILRIPLRQLGRPNQTVFDTLALLFIKVDRCASLHGHKPAGHPAKLTPTQKHRWGGM